MTDDSYSMPIWIGIGIGISISEFFSNMYLILRVLENSGNVLPLVIWSPAFQLVQQSQDLQYYVCTYEM